MLKRHPEIEDIDLGMIVMVTGMQRTGTTLLQRLLASHPGIRGLSVAEALDPVPAADPKGRGQAARRRRAAIAKKAISYLAPQFMAIHPIDYGEPEEDVLLLDLTFMSQSAEAMMHVPRYSRWLEEQDQSRSYEYLRLVLKLLCWQRPTSAWVLKTPQHMEHLDVFLRVFPDATIVQDASRPAKSARLVLQHGGPTAVASSATSSIRMRLEGTGTGRPSGWFSGPCRPGRMQMPAGSLTYRTTIW